MPWRIHGCRILLPLALWLLPSGAAFGWGLPDSFKINLDRFFSVGPTVQARFLTSSQRSTGAISLGVGASAVGSWKGEPWLRQRTLSSGLAAGYVFQDRRAFLDGFYAMGLWRISAGAAVSPSFGRGGTGLTAGPILVGHFRLGDGPVQHELQLVVRGDFALLDGGPTANQLGVGLRFLYDLK